MFLFTALVSLLSHAAASDSDWWDSNFHYRRVVTVSDTIRGAGPTNIALVEFPTLGKVNADGGDIRVVDYEGKEATVQVLAAGIEDRACILFEAPKHGKYQLYFGNPGAKLPQHPPLQAGLTLESRLFAEASVENWKDMQQVLMKNTTVTGRWWMNSPTLSFNPLGPMDHAICIFSGYVNASKDGAYVFATNSVDASFLFIDDKPVASWPGWHDARGGEWAKHNGTLELRAGPHKFDYINAFRGWGVCTIGWKRPADADFVHMNGESFVGTLNTKISPVETVTGGAEADFEWTFDDDLAMEGRRVTGVKFSPLSKGKAFKWDFGDGVTSTEFAPMHIYLESGAYTITLESEGKTTSQKALVQPFRGHMNKPYEKRISTYAEILKSYATQSLSVPALMEMGQIAHEAQQYETAARAFRAALEKGWVPHDGDEAHYVTRLYEIYRDSGRYDDAVWVCDHLAAVENAPPQNVAQALTMKGEVLYDYADKPDAALEVYKSVLQKFKPGSSDFVRLACLRIGELQMVRGDYKEAKRTLEDVERSEMWKKWTGDFQFVNGAHELNFEEYIRQGELEAAVKELQAWEWERPTVLLTGLTRCLRARALLARKEYALAIREYDRALACDKYAPFSDEAWYGKGEAFEALKQHDKAVECFKRIVDDYSTSNLLAKAKEKLK